MLNWIKQKLINTNRNKTVIAAWTLFFVLNGFVVSTIFWVPVLVRNQIQAALKQSCGHCTFTAESIGFSPLMRRITFEKPQFNAGDPGPTPVTAQAERIVALLAPLSLLGGVVRFKQIDLQGPQVTVSEYDRPPEKTARDVATQSPIWNFAVEVIGITHGQFTYRRVRGRREAPIRVRSIEGTVSAVGSTPQLKNAPTLAQATGE